MLLKDFQPSAELSEFVRLYRVVHFVFDKSMVIPVKPYPPSPEHCLSFYPMDTECIEHTDSGKKEANIPVAFIGQPLAVTNRHVGHKFMVLQIIFQPGALYRLTGIPAHELTNLYINAEDIFSKEVQLVNEQLHHASSYQAMILIAENFVRKLKKSALKEQHRVDFICKTLLLAQGNISLDYLAKESFLCTKQFERKFKERAGVNPKLYQRVIRFDKAFQLKTKNQGLDWLRIAVECNYHDYQHLVKDYKDFTGYSPTKFHLLESNTPEKILGLNDAS